MLILKRKICLIGGITTLTVLSVLFLFIVPVFALGTEFTQVKVAGQPAVYFLSHNGQRKKAYINANAYLGYGHQWSDIKIISQYELDVWPVVKLVRAPGSVNIYYIEGAKKALVNSLSDLATFGLAGEPILQANQTDLDQYETVNYAEVGLISQNSLIVESETIYGANNNTLLTNTNGNLLGSFRLRSSGGVATVNSLAIRITGVYSGDLLEDAYVRDQNGNTYDANVSLNKADRQATISFWKPLVIPAGGEKVIRLFLDIGTCTCTNQTMRTEIRSADAIQSDLMVSGQFPLLGTQFSVFAGGDYVGSVRTQEESIGNENLVISNGSRLVGKFNVYEDSGNEDFYLKEITFSNQGNVSWNDWEDFRLLRDGEIIARINDLGTAGRIKFTINYCRIGHESPAELTVVAGLKDGYNTNATVDLQVHSLWSVGKVYGFSLPTDINNLTETITLN